MGQRISDKDCLVVVHDRTDVVLCSFMYFMFVFCIFVELFLLSSYVDDSIDYCLLFVLVAIGIVFTVVKVRYRVVVQNDMVNGIQIQDFDGYKYGFWNQLRLVYKGKVFVRVNIYDEGYVEFEKYISKYLKEI